MKFLIHRFTRHNSVYSIYKYGILILVYTELCLVYLGMAELSGWSGFQMMPLMSIYNIQDGFFAEPGLIYSKLNTD